MKYEIGQRIIYMGPREELINKRGRIISAYDIVTFCIVEFDEQFSFLHDGGGIGTDGHCWVASLNNIKLDNVYLMMELME